MPNEGYVVKKRRLETIVYDYKHNAESDGEDDYEIADLHHGLRKVRTRAHAAQQVCSASNEAITPGSWD